MSPPRSTVVEIDASHIAATWPVMQQLRPHLTEQSYVEIVARMRKIDHFRVAAILQDGVVRAVAGFRTMEMLYCGRILSIDDLVVDKERRSCGLGRLLLDWLKDQAIQLGCRQIHLDSRLIRLDAHRFYRREGFQAFAYHFVAELGASGDGPAS